MEIDADIQTCYSVHSIHINVCTICRCRGTSTILNSLRLVGRWVICFVLLFCFFTFFCHEHVQHAQNIFNVVQEKQTGWYSEVGERAGFITPEPQLMKKSHLLSCLNSHSWIPNQLHIPQGITQQSTEGSQDQRRAEAQISEDFPNVYTVRITGSKQEGWWPVPTPRSTHTPGPNPRWATGWQKGTITIPRKSKDDDADSDSHKPKHPNEGLRSPPFFLPIFIPSLIHHFWTCPESTLYPTLTISSWQSFNLITRNVNVGYRVLHWHCSTWNTEIKQVGEGGCRPLEEWINCF